MKQITLLLVLLISSLFSVSQTNPSISWQWQQSFANDSDVVVSFVRIDGYDNIYISGSFVDTLIIGSDTALTTLLGNPGTFILKLSSSGSPIWMEPNAGKAIVIGNDGNIYCNGIIRDPATGAQIGLFDAGKTFTIDGNNDLICATWNESDFVNPIVATFRKYSGSTLIWEKLLTLDSYSLEASISEIRTDMNHNIYISGVATDSIFVSGGQWASTPKYNSQRMFVARFSPNGELIWVNEPSNANSLSMGYGFDLNNSTGQLLVTGQLVGDMTIGNTTIGAPGISSAFLLGFDLNGNLTRTAQFTSENNECCNSGMTVKGLDDGSLYLQAIFRDTLILGNDTLIEDKSNPYNGMVADDVFLTRFDAAWNPVKTYFIGNVGNVFEGEFDLTTSGSVVLVGYDIFSVSRGVSSSWENRAGFVGKSDVFTVGLDKPILYSNGLHAYPNPVANVLYYNVSSSIEYSIFDAKGSFVAKGLAREGSNELIVSEFEHGLYMLTLADGRSVRFVVTR